MAIARDLFMYSSTKSKGIFCFSLEPKGAGLPPSLAPWEALGVVRPDQTPPHGLSRVAIETGIREKGYQLWREKLNGASSKKES